MVRCAITNGSRFPNPTQRRAGLLADAARWAASRIDLVQLREPHLPAAELIDLARAMLGLFHAHATPTHRTKLLINARPDIAVAAAADGVHLPAHPGALTPTQVRRIFAASSPNPPIVSLSCHTLADVHRAAAPDLILFAPVFEKRLNATLVLPGTGLDLLRQACSAAPSIPILALGGITPDNASACLQAGAAGIAAIRLFA